MSTHEDWLDARRQRNSAACRAVRYLNAGELDAAKEAAKEAEAFDAEMERISDELDGTS